MGDIRTGSGTKVFIGPAVATTPANAAAYAALAWTEIGMIETVGEYGDQSAAVAGNVLGEARVRKAKGARDGGDWQVTVFPDETDTGQQAVIAAEATTSNYAIKVVEPNRLAPGGTDGITYFKVLVMSKRKNASSTDDLKRLTFNMGINSPQVEVAPTSGA